MYVLRPFYVFAPLVALRLLFLVPSARLELAQLSPLPPQDSVSTNFTTTAVTKKSFCRSLRNVLLRRCWRCRRSRCPGCWRCLFRSAFFLRCIVGFRRRAHALHDAARYARRFRRVIRKRDARRKKHRCRNGSGAAQKVRRSRRTKYATGRATAECSAHVGPFTLLQEHEHDERDRCQHVYRKHD
jgi:hypothetical protein